MDNQGPRHAVITSDDRGALLQIAAWFMMVVTILATMSRLIVRLTTAQVFGLDDVVIAFAMLLAVGGTIAVSLAVNDGLGRRIVGLNEFQILGIRKNVYASTILYLFTLATTKISTVLLISKLVVVRTHILLARSLGLVVLLWLIASVAVVGAQCNMSRSWDAVGGTCLDLPSFWIVVGGVDILIDVLTIALPVWIVCSLQLDLRRKVATAFIFSARLIVVATAVVRLILLIAAKQLPDSNLDSIPYHICTQLQASGTVIIACLTAVKPFMALTDTGMLNISVFGTSPGGTYLNSNSYAMQSFSKGGKDTSYGIHAKEFQSEQTTTVREQEVVQKTSTIDDNISVESNGSKQMFIRQTSQWEVRYDDDRDRTTIHPSSS